MAYPKVGISGKGGSFSIASGGTSPSYTYTEHAMTDWTLTKEVDSTDVTNFLSRPANTSIVATGSTAQAMQQVIAGVRKFSLEAKGYPIDSTGASGLLATRAQQDASVVPAVNAGAPNIANPMVVGEKVVFRLGIEGGASPSLSIGPFEARITDFKYTNSVSGALECTISAVGTAPDAGTAPTGFTG